MSTTTGTALTTTHRMSYRVHGYATNVGATATMPVSPGLAYANILVIHIANLANSGPTLDANHTQLAGR